MGNKHRDDESPLSRGRRDPDELLARIKSEETPKSRLTLFFGMAAGVGKTYAMLQAARAALDAGKDIVVALAETHGRPETDALLDGIELIPLKKIPYRGLELEEVDADAVVDRAPEIAIVDELAHTNVPGSRHVKRWQDVLELLDRGISVWTALNVQHAESLADVVESVVGVPIRERVPDTVLDRADEIRLIDLSPEDLIRRMKEGKVYTGDSSREAIEGFFRLRNLGALRELALRYAARRAERALSAYSRAEGSPPPTMNTGGRILVAVGSSPSSAYLVRWARRTAYALRAGWIALHVETGERLSREDESRLEENLALARKLGAESVIVPGSDIAQSVIDEARARGVSMIVIGRSGLSPLGPLPKRATVSDKIVRAAGAVDVAVIQDQSVSRASIGLSGIRRLFEAPFRQYLLLALVFAGMTAAGTLLVPWIGYRSLALIFIGAVLALSFVADPGPVTIFAVVSALALNFLFIPPLYTFTIGTAEDIILFGVYFLVAAVTASLVTKLRAKERLLAVGERRAVFLLEASRRLSECESGEEAAFEAARLLEAHFGTEAAVLVADDKGLLIEKGQGGAVASLDERELAAAAYAFNEKAFCGAGTDSLPFSRLRYAPAAAGEKASGVIAVRIPVGRTWTKGDDNLLLSLGRTLALAIGRGASEAQKRRTALAIESERISTLLLDSVSHELRTPLTTILGSVTALRDDALANAPAARREILSQAIQAAERLDRLVGDLLSLNRLESGKLKLDIAPCSPEDIAEECLRESRDAIGGREVILRLPERSILVDVDSSLVAKVAANLLRNAGTYSSCEGPFELRIEIQGEDMILAVRDPGPGIPASELPSMFERFARGRGAPNGGLGLGLAICKGIVEAHKGKIEASTLSGGRFEVKASFPNAVK